MRILGVIPARYSSSRFPGKPLAIINGKPMIRRVYEQAMKSSKLDKVVVATDDERIEKAVKDFGGEVLMTSINHQTGTDRCNEVLAKEDNSTDVVINIQGDEPYIDPAQIDQLCSCFEGRETEIGTLIKEIDDKNELFNINKPKVVVDRSMNAIYFSRHPIPYQKNIDESEWLNNHRYYKHIGIYGYRADILSEISKLDQSKLELAESLEQLRWLENGFLIRTKVTKLEAHSVDTPDDLEFLVKKFGG